MSDKLFSSEWEIYSFIKAHASSFQADVFPSSETEFFIPIGIKTEGLSPS